MHLWLKENSAERNSKQNSQHTVELLTVRNDNENNNDKDHTTSLFAYVQDRELHPSRTQMECSKTVLGGHMYTLEEWQDSTGRSRVYTWGAAGLGDLFRMVQQGSWIKIGKPWYKSPRSPQSIELRCKTRLSILSRKESKLWGDRNAGEDQLGANCSTIS